MYKKGNYADLSDFALHYIGGILKHAPSLLAFCAPTTNSYKRLVPGFEAPVNIAYSAANRTASVRIPNNYTASPKAKRIEFRCPDPSANPYLALLNDYIKPMLLHWSLVEYLPFAGVNISNGGIYTKNPENSTALTKEHVDSLVERCRSVSQFYTNRFIDFMQNNAAGLIPEYYSNSQEDMYPDDVADFGGWVL